MTVSEERENPVWGYEDLALLAGAALPILAVALLVVRAAHFSNTSAKTLAYQFLIYLLSLGALYLLISYRYRKPFWSSLKWTLRFRGAWMLAGPPLAIGLVALGAVLRAPQVSSPLENLLSDRRVLVFTALFVVIFGPAWEELLFRGFLLPLLARSLGVWPGIVVTAVPFALLHGAQSQWTWQNLTVIGVAGIVFGFVRSKTGSTIASAMVHSGYNFTLLVGYLVQHAG
jgi:membrane protease YdiL (CAAX protease family)